MTLGTGQSALLILAAGRPLIPDRNNLLRLRSCNASTTKKYEFQATWSRWWIDAIPPFNDIVGPILPSHLVDGIARGQFGLITHPGIWKMTGIITIPSNVQRDFDLKDGWHYEIVGNPREDR